MSPQPLPVGQILEPLRPRLAWWLGPDAVDGWLRTVDTLPVCSRLFLEFHPASRTPRCDIITSVLASDGSLSAWLDQQRRDVRPVWNKTIAFLRKWHQQLSGQQGALAAYCFMVWLEFDIVAAQGDAGDPAMFIALTPQAEVAEIADELSDYPELQTAILNFTAAVRRNAALQEDIVRANPLVLGHIGYMGSRQRGEVVLPLRSCWRSANLTGIRQLLHAAALPIDHAILSEQTRWLEDCREHINSVMLHLDSYDEFLPDFSLEVNVFNPYASSAKQMEHAVLQSIVDAGFMSADQKNTLSGLSGPYSSEPRHGLRCSLHHFKLKFSGSKIQEVKCYWSIR